MRQARPPQRRPLSFLAVAIVFAILMDRVVLHDSTALRDAARRQVAETRTAQPAPSAIIPPLPQVQIAKPDFAPAHEFVGVVAPQMPPSPVPEEREEKRVPQPAWIKYAVPAAAPKDKPKVVVIIDDAGLDRKRAAQVMDLPGPLTISFMTYAHDLKAQSEAARKHGHELMLHVPMEPVNGRLDAFPAQWDPKLGIHVT